MNVFKSPMHLNPEIPGDPPASRLGPTYGNRVVSEQWFGPASTEADLRRERASAARLRHSEHRLSKTSILDQG